MDDSLEGGVCHRHGSHKVGMVHSPASCRGRHNPQLWHKQHVGRAYGPASRTARWQQTLAKVDLTVVCVSGQDNTVADCLSRYAYPASKSMTDVFVMGVRLLCPYARHQ